MATAYTDFIVDILAAGASNLNAGSTSGAPFATYAEGSWVNSTRVFTVATGNPSSDGVTVGMFGSVFVTIGATVAVFVARVTAVSSTTITFSATAKSGTAPADQTLTATCIIGGAWLGPATTSAFPFNFVETAMMDTSSDPLRVNVRARTGYAVTAAMTIANSGIVIEGYTTTIGDGGMTTISGGASGTSYVVLTVSGANNDFRNLIFSGNGATGAASGVLSSNGENVFRRCVFTGMRGNGLSTSGSVPPMFIECEAYANNASNTAANGGFSGLGVFRRCISHDNTGSNSSGFIVTGASVLTACIADTNGAHGFNVTTNVSASMVSCDGYNNTGDGVRFANTTAACFDLGNCNFVKNGGWGVNGSGAGSRNGNMVNCAFGAGTQVNGSGTFTGLNGIMESGSVTYASNVTPWVDPANGDFRITLAAAKAAGRGTFLQTAASYAGTVAFPDIGAGQAADNVGGGVSRSRVANA